ncbi:MAG TPA: DUF2490 domain-containing protein [Verrucomicrobiae bacterium]|jgi:hypothetical protein
MILPQNAFRHFIVLWCLYLFAGSARADISEDYRLTAFPYYTFSNKITVFAQLGYGLNRNGHAQTYNLLSPGAYFTANPWLQLWGGLNDRYNQNNDKADTFVFRPFAGPRLSLPNRWKWNLYNFTQYEYRATKNFDTHDWSSDNRIRSRFEADLPLSTVEHTWQPRTWYALASVEPFYDFNQSEVSQLRVSGGIGYVFSKYAQLEFVYYAKFRQQNGGGLEYSENIFRLNLKISLNREGDVQNAAAIR